MERSPSSWRKVFLLGKVEILQDVQGSGLCMVTLVTVVRQGAPARSEL